MSYIVPPRFWGRRSVWDKGIGACELRCCREVFKEYQRLQETTLRLVRSTPKVIASMEGDPRDIAVQDNTAGHQQLGKVDLVNPFLDVCFEIDAAVKEEPNRFRGVHVIFGVELPEIELPDTQLAIVLGQLPFLIAERQAKLNHLEHVHICANGCILVCTRSLELANGFDHHTCT